MFGSGVVVSRRAPRLAAIASVVVLVVALLTGPAVRSASAASCHPYPDVSSSNSACANISWLKDQEITKPADGKYHPLASVTRGSMAAFLFRLTHPGKASPACTSKPFPDVATSNVFCGYIAWAKANHVAFGYSDGTYGPDNAVTRGAMAAYLFRIANPGQGASKCTKAPFADVAVSDTFCGVITWMLASKITYGVGGGKYGTALPVTRQAMASFLRRTATLTGVGSSTVTGTVIDTRGRALSGARLRLGSASATSNSAGRFTLSGVPGGREITLTASKAGYARASLAVTPMSTKTTSVQVQLQNRPTASTATIAGTVKDTGGAHLAGVRVLVIGGGVGFGYAYSATTDRSGSYSITGIKTFKDPNIYFQVCFDASGVTNSAAPAGYANSCYHDQYWPSMDLPAAFAKKHNLSALHMGRATYVQSEIKAGKTFTANAVLSPAASMTGRVTSAVTGKPMKNVLVMSWRVAGDHVATGYGAALTASDGTYELTGLDPTADGYKVCFDPGSSDATVPTGYVTQCFRGHNVNGTFARFGDHFSASNTVSVRRGHTTAGINASLVAGGVVTGVVTSPNGKPADHAWVNLYLPTQTGWGGSAEGMTDSTGHYRIQGIAPGRYTACSDWVGYGCYNHKKNDDTADAFTVRSGKVTTINIVEYNDF